METLVAPLIGSVYFGGLAMFFILRAIRDNRPRRAQTTIHLQKDGAWWPINVPCLVKPDMTVLYDLSELPPRSVVRV